MPSVIKSIGWVFVVAGTACDNSIPVDPSRASDIATEMVTAHEALAEHEDDGAGNGTHTPSPSTDEEDSGASLQDMLEGRDTGAIDEAPLEDHAASGSTSETEDKPSLVDRDHDGFTLEDGDCDDLNRHVRPGAPELCDGIDNNCNGAIDEVGAIDAPTHYRDHDGDGFGLETDFLIACRAPLGFVSVAGDCDDECTDCHPDGVETCDGQDNDCDGEVDEGEAVGSALYYLDADRDGYGDPDTEIAACEPPFEHVANADDCCDLDPATNPANTRWGTEPDACGFFDHDCDGLESEQIPTLGDCEFDGSTCVMVGEGWVGFVPECGEEGSILDSCRLEMDDSCSGGVRCVPESADEVQECR